MKHLLYSALAILFVYTSLVAQPEQMKSFNLLDPIDPTPESFIIQNTESDLLMFWIDSTDLQMSKSVDDGITWGTPTLLVHNTLALDDLQDLNAIKLKSGRILVTYKQRYHYSIYSDDNGGSWSDPVQLVTELGTVKPRKVNQSSLSQTNDNKIWFVYDRSNIIYNIKSDDGVTWSERDTLINSGYLPTYFGSVNSFWNDSLIFIYEKREDSVSSIFQSISSDNGITWTESEIILDDEILKYRARVVRDTTGTLWLSYLVHEETPFKGYKQTNIYFTQYPNGADGWETPQKYTNYVGFDGWQNVSTINDKLYISFTSDRDGIGHNIWYGIAGETVDSGAPVAIYYTQTYFLNNFPTVDINILAAVYHTAEIDSVLFNYQYQDSSTKSVQLFDDGLHNDEEAGDFIFGNDLIGLDRDFSLEYYFSTLDVNGNSSMTKTSELSSPFLPDGGESFAFDNNNIWLPINNSGVIGDIYVSAPDGLPRSGGWFDEERFLFSSGFALSGYT
ncbi:MAG: exo-alpha-sialidase, partial [Melioribacteraceae bacterium]|nr:exo-alpha-sialidase [Melioribacteraceae bacterium]